MAWPQSLGGTQPPLQAVAGQGHPRSESLWLKVNFMNPYLVPAVNTKHLDEGQQMKLILLVS